MILDLTPTRDEYDEPRVLKATCEHCHSEFSCKPPERDCPRCMTCGATGCPECFHHMQFDYCDMCDDVICSKHFRTVMGMRVCPQEKCAKDAAEVAEAARRTARAQQVNKHPRRRA